LSNYFIFSSDSGNLKTQILATVLALHTQGLIIGLTHSDFLLRPGVRVSNIDG